MLNVRISNQPFYRLITILALVLLNGCTYFIDKSIEDSLTQEASIIQYPDGLNVFLCGTGTPYPDETRNPSCLAVVAGSEFLVFDAGEGTSRRLDTMGLPTKELDAVFITHWHSDHFSGLDYLINTSWIFGRQQELIVYGPEGVNDVIKGITMAYSLDSYYRSGLEKGELDRTLSVALPYSVSLSSSSSEKLTIFNRNGVTVSAFSVDHSPVEPALGYIVEYKGRKLVISGDTKIATNVETYANGADILVHEALNVPMIENAARVAREIGMSSRAKQIESIVPYHANTEEVAKLAQRANVDKLVLTHFIPAPSNWLAEMKFIETMDQYFDGEIIVGEDKMSFHLPPQDD